MDIQFEYGCMGESLEEQANKQGLTLGDKSEFLEKLKKSLIMCGFHVLTQSESGRAFKKLHKKVMESIKPIERKE